MEPDDLTQHCFRCKGLVVVNPATLKALTGMLWKAARRIDDINHDTGYLDYDNLVGDLRAMASIIEMIPDD